MAWPGVAARARRSARSAPFRRRARRAGPRAGTRGSGSGSEDDERVQSRPGACQVRPLVEGSMKPIRSRRATAPGMLPMPPSTAAVKANSPSGSRGRSAMREVEQVDEARRRRPARPPSRKVNEIVRSTSMPISAAASRSCAVARIAFPCASAYDQASASRSGNVIEQRRSACSTRRRSADVKIARAGGQSGASTVVRRRPEASPTFWRMNDIPIAVISGASRGALRSRR